MFPYHGSSTRAEARIQLLAHGCRPSRNVAAKNHPRVFRLPIEPHRLRRSALGSKRARVFLDNLDAADVRRRLSSTADDVPSVTG